MLQVLIINSPLFAKKIRNYSEDSLPPLGLGYIATNLRNNCIKTELLDAISENLSIKEIINFICIKKPKFVALNIFTTNFELVKKIIEKCHTKTNFVIGGQITGHVYKKILKFKTRNKIDIIIGEGDYIVSDLITNHLKEFPVLSQNNRRVFNVNKNSKYFPADLSKIPLDRDFFKNEPTKNHFGFVEANIITSRGCIYNCAFCGAARSLNLNCPVRLRSSKNIKCEIKKLKLIYIDLQCIRVLDDLFLKNNDCINEAIKIFNSVKLKWRSMAHILPFQSTDNSLAIKIKNSGCLELFVGIESGSQKILKFINKNHNLKMIKETILMLLSAGINVKGYFMYGFPQETENDFKQTYNLAIELKKFSLSTKEKFRVSVFQFRPYHGTKLYNYIFNNYGIIKNIKENKKITEKIGRRQFNFATENYSQCSNALLYNYIIKTAQLND